MNFPFSYVSLLGCIVLLSATTTQGGVIITVGSATLQAGETKPVDILIRSDSNNPLQAFGIRLQLDTTGIGSLLQLTDPLNTEWPEPSYVFSGDSLAENTSSFAMLSLTSTTNDTFDSADATQSGANIMLTSSDQLLARVYVKALGGASAGVFDLNFDNSVSTFYNSVADEQSFASTHGTVTVLDNAVIPEPISCVLWMGGFATMAMAKRARRRSPATH